MRSLLIFCLLLISTVIGRAASTFTVRGDDAANPTNLNLPGHLRSTNYIGAIGGLEVDIGQTNTHLTASKIILTGTGKQLLSSAFGESDLAGFLTSSATNGFQRIIQFNPNQFLVINGTNVSIISGPLLTNIMAFGITNNGYYNGLGGITNAGGFKLTTAGGTPLVEVDSADFNFSADINYLPASSYTIAYYSGGNRLYYVPTGLGALTNNGTAAPGNVGYYDRFLSATNDTASWGAFPFRITLGPDGSGGAKFSHEDSGDQLVFTAGGRINLPNFIASTLLKLDSSKNISSVFTGTGALTNDGAGGIDWFNGYITAASLDGYGFIFGATNIGSTIGRGSNFVLIVESNLTQFATNYPAGGGTNVDKLDTAQPITTTAQPTFAGLTDTGNLAVQGTTTNTGAINSAGVETNWNDVYMLTNVTIAANQASKWPYKIPDLALTTTNASGGVRWEDFFPNPTRRRFALLLINASGSISWFGEANANSGTLAYETPTTNLWWTVSYTTAASANSDAGGNTTSQAFSPGQDLVWDWVGRIDAIGTNNVRHWIGLTSTTLANMGATDSPTTRSVAAIRFSQAVPDTEWKFVTCDGTACTTTTSTTAATTNLVHFKLVEDYANARWIFFLNGVPAATNSANLPIATMGSIMSVRTLINKAYVIRTSMMSCFQSDKQTILQYP